MVLYLVTLSAEYEWRIFLEKKTRPGSSLNFSCSMATLRRPAQRVAVHGKGMKVRFNATVAAAEEVRYNEVNIQMLPTSLHWQLFSDFDPSTGRPGRKPKNIASQDAELVQLSQEHLKRHNIPFTERRFALPAPQIPNMPPLLNGSIERHFWTLER